MLEKVFWNYFENTGNINTYIASKEYDEEYSKSNCNTTRYDNLTNSIENEDFLKKANF